MECWVLSLKLVTFRGLGARSSTSWMVQVELGSASAIFNWPARDPGGGKLTLRNWLVGWTALGSPSSELSCGSDYRGLFTQPASTTCSHSTPPSSDKPSSLQIETNLPLPRSPTAQLFVRVSGCTCVFKRSRRNSGCRERD